MAVITPPSVTALPTPPSTASPATFDARADAFLGALPTFQTETDALAANVAANATDAAASAVLANVEVGNAAAQAVAAAASAVTAAINAAAAAAATGASIWVSGTTYSIGDVRYSPTNQRVYRRKTAGAGTTDPSADSTNWGLVSTDPIWVTKTSNYTAMAGDALLVNTTGGAITITLPAAPAANDVVRFADYAGTWGTNKVTLGRNGLKIMGLAEDYDITTANLGGAMTYIDTTQGWKHL